MTRIALDCAKLLGFKIIAGGSTTKLCSPKIGAKGCQSIEAHADVAPRLDRGKSA